MLIESLTILAQAGGKTSQQPGGQGFMLIGLILMVVVFWFVMSRGNKRQQRERADMLGNLSKNDKVMTIGGIIGTVVQVREHEVVVKVDESNNTKMTFIKKSIQQVIQEGDLSKIDKT